MMTASRTVDALVDALKRKQSFTLGAPTEVDDALVLLPTTTPLVLDEENGLLAVDGGVRVAFAAEFCRARGFVFPLSEPVPDVAIVDALALMAPFTDAFVASADLVTADGVKVSTPRAPRSATGPDLLGLALVDPPLAVMARANIRVFAADRTPVRHESHASMHDVVDRVVALMHAGRAFVVEASGFHVHVVGQCEPRGEEVSPPGFAAVAQGCSLVVDKRDLHAALSIGGRLLAAPYMGRIGVLDDARSSRRFGADAPTFDAWTRREPVRS